MLPLRLTDAVLGTSSFTLVLVGVRGELQRLLALLLVQVLLLLLLLRLYVLPPSLTLVFLRSRKEKERFSVTNNEMLKSIS